MEISAEEFLVVSLPRDQNNPELPDTMLIFTDPHKLKVSSIRKLTNAICYFVCSYNCTDKTKMNFLLWYSDMLCKKLGDTKSTGLQCELIEWIFSPSETLFSVSPYRTAFVTLHQFEEGCFTSTELDILRQVGENFLSSVSEIIEDGPEYEGGERELVRT